MLVQLCKQVISVAVPNVNATRNQTVPQLLDINSGETSDDEIARRTVPLLAKRERPLHAESSPSFEDTLTDVSTTTTIKRRKVESLELIQGSLYCPFKHCSFSTVENISVLCKHIHYFHDYKFPLYDPGNPTYGIELSKRQIDLTDPRKVVLPGDLIRPLFKKPTTYNSVPTVSFLCPYRECPWSTNSRSHSIKHIRAAHNSIIPFHIRTSYILMSSSGTRVQLSDDPQWKVLDSDEIIRAIFPGKDSEPLFRASSYDARKAENEKLTEGAAEGALLNKKFFLVEGSRRYCPYVNCPYFSGDRSQIYAHIRSRHFAALPKLQANRKLVIKTTMGDIVRFDGTDEVPRSITLVVEYDRIDLQNRFFCPYEGCEVSLKCRASLLHHIRCYHDPELPAIGSGRRPFTLQTSSGEEVHLSYNMRKPIPEGEGISVVWDSELDPDRWHCPYRACAGLSYKAEGAIFRHIRVVHQEDFPNAKPNILREVQTLDGRLVDFNGDPRKLLDSDEQLTIVYKSKDHPCHIFQCPFKQCVFKGKGKPHIYKHIREVHTATFPIITPNRGPSISRCARTKKNIVIGINEEQFMEEGDAVEVLYKNEMDTTVKLSYCPYRDCTSGCFRNPCNLYKHIRENHDPLFIVNSASGKLVIYVGSSNNKKIIDLSARTRGILDADVQLQWKREKVQK